MPIYDMNFIHPEPTPMAGHFVQLKPEAFNGGYCLVRDWWDRIAGKSWTDLGHLPAVTQYRERRPSGNVLDDEVLLGMLEDGRAVLLHATEVQRVMPAGWTPGTGGTFVPPSVPLPETPVEAAMTAAITSDAAFTDPKLEETKPLLIEPHPALLEELKAMKASFDKIAKLVGI